MGSIEEDRPNTKRASLIAEALTSPFLPKLHPNKKEILNQETRKDRWKIRYLRSRLCLLKDRDQPIDHRLCTYCLIHIPWRCHFSMPKWLALYERLFQSK